MFRRLVIVALAILAVASASTESNACGDKFLRIGRSSRLNGYAAVHPSSIVLLLPGKAKRAAVKEFERALKRAGHTFQAVDTPDALPAALDASRVDIVIATPDDAVKVRSYARAAASKPRILPVAHNASEAALASIQREYGHVLKLPATKYEALEEIDHVMAERLKNSRSAAASQ